MAKTKMGVSLLMSLLLTEAALALNPKTYIVQMNSGAATTSANRLARRQSSLQAVDVDPTTAMLYSYDTILDGYAATLTDAQATALRAQADVLSVRRDTIKKLHTTHTPTFLGLDDAALLQQRGLMSSSMNPLSYVEARQAGVEEEANIIVGVLDTGYWPESESYSDEGMSSPPASWMGACEEGDRFTADLCNNKLIGAKAFYKGLEAGYAADNQTFDWSTEYKSARDAEGHGTHTSSTIAGTAVAGASLFGQAEGTARGVAEGARLAIYKVCYLDVGCFDSDILAGMDAAVADGVNIISSKFFSPCTAGDLPFLPKHASLPTNTPPVSLGGNPALGSESDSITTGSYAATAKGVLVSASAGNSGPTAGSVSNNAPWIFTIAASTLDRAFPANIVLGTGTIYTGQSLYTNISVTDVEPTAASTLTPFILGSSAVVAGGLAADANLCLAGSLDPALVAGKVVLCERGNNGRVEKGGVVRDAGGLGMVLVNDPASGESVLADAHMLPAVALGNSALAPLTDYITTSGNASVVFDFTGTVLGVSAPEMASFSSRGPNYPSPDILKPDITGPGVNILAAWSAISPSGVEGDERKVAWNIISGTSMSCPHLSGTAAYVMARRPEWSIAQVKSALMTTAYPTTKGAETTILDQADGASASVFDYGNGHVDPTAALDPGLLYDIQPTEYLDFLCAFNYTDAQIRTISRDDFSCDPAAEYSLYDLNYPSFAVWYNTNTTTGDKTVTFNRNVTNVGEASTYTVSVAVEDSSLVSVKVEPETLDFSATGEGQIYSVTVTLADPGVASSAESVQSSARLTWTDGTHTVASSMGFFWGAPDNVGYDTTESTLGPI